MTLRSLLSPTHRRYAHRWLLLIPFIWQVGGTPLVNTAAVRVFSLPLPMLWQMCGILVASATIGFVFARDERIEANDEPDSFSEPSDEGKPS